MTRGFKALLIAGFVVSAALIGYGAVSHAEETRTFFGEPSQDNGVQFARDEIEIQSSSGQSYYFDVELALTAEQQSQGMMFRTSMDTNSGMLFLFEGEKKRSFWMKNTLIPLDMLFVAADGEIHHIHHSAKPQDLTSITSLFPSKAVLELKGGSADILGIKEGDMIIHSVFRNDTVQK